MIHGLHCALPLSLPQYTFQFYCWIRARQTIALLLATRNHLRGEKACCLLKGRTEIFGVIQRQTYVLLHFILNWAVVKKESVNDNNNKQFWFTLIHISLKFCLPICHVSFSFNSVFWGFPLLFRILLSGTWIIPLTVSKVIFFTYIYIHFHKDFYYFFFKSRCTHRENY